MKLKLITLGLLITFSCSLLAQEKQSLKKSIGFTFSTISSDVINSAGMTSLGGPSYSGKSAYTLGVSYIHPIRSWIDIESGVEYSNHTITVEPIHIPGFGRHPEYDKDISLINIPITARINFLKYFFVNGGIMFDFEIGKSSPIKSQTGIGTILGVGAKYNLSNGLGTFINGYYKSHSLIPFSADNGNDYRWRLIEGGLRIGITYNF